MERKNLNIKQLEANKGQIAGLPSNPRFIKDKRFKDLVKSIEDAPEMLEYRTLLVVPNADKYVVICGNMRLRACKEIGYKELPCVVLDADTPVEKLREYTIKDNIGFGSDDWDALANEWDENELTEWGMELPNEWGEKEAAEVQEDDFDADAEVETICKRGEVWQLGEHRLMCGHSTSEEDVAKLMNGEKADLFITDPPYGVSYGDKNKFLNTMSKGNKIQTNIENDHMTEDEMYELWKQVFKNAHKNTKSVMAYYVFSAQGGNLLLLLLLQALKDSGFIPKHGLVWVKNNHVLGRADYNYKHEPITYGWKFEGSHNFYGHFDTSVFEDNLDVDKLKKDELLKLVKDILSDKYPTSVIKENKPLKNDLHPTMKPIKLIARLILNSSKEYEIVLDLFGGSGSTLIAAEQLKRKCYMMELDEHYCDVIIARWEKYTGQKAVRIE